MITITSGVHKRYLSFAQLTANLLRSRQFINLKDFHEIIIKQKLCKFIKLSMDEKYGPMWHVTAGEMYGAKLDHDPGMLMQLTYGMGGKYTINIWRA